MNGTRVLGRLLDVQILELQAGGSPSANPMGFGPGPTNGYAIWHHPTS